MTDREDATQTALPAGVAPFPWHVQALAQLAGQRERLPHALLFTGPGGIGKRALALALGQALLCEAPLPAGLACGQCPGCRFVASRQHPDLVLLEPVEYDEDHNATPVEWIVIDRIREVTQFVQITSHRG
ncbi:MAG TPA: hypothetical protein VMV45_18960, partial [Casimicrobiaceae bacterium]|nr:hypothetical protein [Casimicrobiaceae bacterium]